MEDFFFNKKTLRPARDIYMLGLCPCAEVSKYSIDNPTKRKQKKPTSSIV